MNHCIPHYIISIPATFPAHHNLLHLNILTSDALYNIFCVPRYTISTQATFPAHHNLPHLTILTSDDPHTHTHYTFAHSAVPQTAPLYNHSRYTHFPLHFIFGLFVMCCHPASHFTPTHKTAGSINIQVVAVLCHNSF